MAKFVCVLLLSLLCISMVVVQAMAESTDQYQLNGYGPGRLKSYQCPSQCARRCGQTQYKKPCLFFCQKCCAKCLCVPPGYYGNKGLCPCYNHWKTKRGGPKCP